MNTYLKDIYAQPKELVKVFHELMEKEYKTMRQIAALLSVADEIILTSMGSAYYSLMPMYDALERSRKRVTLVESARILFTPELIRKNAVYVIMSRSGESGEIAQLSEKLKQENCVCIGITMTPDSALAKNAAIILHDPSEYDSLICTKAYTTMALCGLLCTTLMRQGSIGGALESSLLDMFQWMEEQKEAILHRYEEAHIFRDLPGIYFLSRGYGMYTIQSASLWLEETAKIYGNVLSLDNFYHGPIELSKTGIVPVLLDVNPDARSRMIWNKIKENLHVSLCVAPENSGQTGTHTLSYPSFPLPQEYMILMQALFFQLMAYQCALEKGIEPGRMETLSWVVR